MEEAFKQFENLDEEMNNQAEMQDGGNDDQGRCEVDHATEEVATSSTFTGTYRKSIAPIISLPEDPIGRSIWAGHPIETHSHASEHEMVYVFAVLRTLSPLWGDKLHIYISSINKLSTMASRRF